MKFQCCNCKKVIDCEDQKAGTAMRCEACGQTVSVPDRMFDPGTVIADYVIRNHIADGDMGRIYLAEELSTGRKSALKILSEDHTYDAKFIVSFIREGRFAAKHRIPNTVDVYSVGEENGYFYYAMAYVQGKSLAQYLKEKEFLPLEEAITIVEQIVQVLSESWKLGRIVHRSIKPDNILIEDDGNVKLADYGLARDYLDLASRSEEEKLRLVQYVPPECLFDFSMTHLKPSSDLYSLGAVFYHAVTGRPPQAGFSISEIISGKIPANPTAPAMIRSEIPDDLSNMILKMLAKRPEDRFQYPEDLQEMLHAFRLDTAPTAATQRKSQTSLPAVTVKMKRPAPEKPSRPESSKQKDDSVSRLDSMRKEREARSQTIVLLITLSLLIISVFFVLFIRWLVYEPRESVRKMELNIARMKEQATLRKSLHRPLRRGAPELLCRGVVALCADEDFVAARRYIREFSMRYPVDPNLHKMLTYHVNNASIFFQNLCYSQHRISGAPLYTESYGPCQILSVYNAEIKAKTADGKILEIPIRAMNTQEYMKYLHSVASSLNLATQMRSYLACTGNFRMAIILAQTEEERMEYERIAYSYIRSGIVNASPMEIRQLRMLYGTLKPFRKAMSKRTD